MVDQEGLSDVPIDVLNLSVRAHICLKRAGVNTVGQVLQKNRDELFAIRNFSTKNFEEVREKLSELGLI